MFSDTIRSPYDGVFTCVPDQTPTNGEPDGPLTGNGNIGLVFGLQDGLLKGFLSTNSMWCALPTHWKGGVKHLAAFTLGFDGLSSADFAARQVLQTADLEVRLTCNTCTLVVDSFVPYYESCTIFRVSCETGSCVLNTGLDAPEFEHCNIQRAQSDICVEITKEYDRSGSAFVTAAKAKLTRIDGGSLHCAIRKGETLTFIVAVSTNHDPANPQPHAFDLATARKDHLSHWAAFWAKSAVHIPSQPLIEKYWAASQYIMACSARADYFAPGIFGPFITTDLANWGSDYHLNYNYQAPWWGVFSSNHVELSEPYDAPLLEYIPAAQKNAWELLGCRGIYSVVGIGPKGYEAAAMFNKADGSPNRQAPFWGQKSNAAYAAVNMLMRFYATYDADYAREKAYPYCKEVAAFWQDYLQWDGKRYVIVDDCIHENAYLVHQIRDVDLDVPDYTHDFNPIVSLGLIRMVLKGLLQMTDFLQLQEPEREKWQHILVNLSDYPTQQRDGKTVFRYTERGMAWSDGNSLGIQHIYPARAIGLSSDKQLLQIARDTLLAMSRWEDYNAFPTFFTAAAYLGYDPDDLLKRLNRELRVHGFSNGFVYYGGGGLECCSTVPATVNAMLLQSHEEYIRVFPVWNRKTDAAFENLRADGAFLVSARLKNGQIGPLTVTSEQGRTMRLLCPWPEGLQVISAGEKLAADYFTVPDGTVYTFATEKGKTYLVQGLHASN